MSFFKNLFKKSVPIAKIKISTSIETERVKYEPPPGWKSPKYDPPMKSKQDLQKYPGNVNYQTFQGVATSAKTNRIHTIDPFNAFSRNEAVQILTDQGYIPDTIQIERCAPKPPTERQIAAMKKHKDFMPKYMCFDDASAIISRYMSDDVFAGKDLLMFANTQKFQISYYEGYGRLCWMFLNYFDGERKIAFYILCVGKKDTGTWHFDKYDKYLTDAKTLMSNQSFISSLNRLAISDRDSGFLPEKLSRQTNCYKMASVLV